MAESVFETVKQSVTVREAAQMYGIEVNRSGMACCPFHDDKNPSMKLNEEYFYCFGCGAHRRCDRFCCPALQSVPQGGRRETGPRFWPGLWTVRPLPGGAMSGRKPRHRSSKRTGTMPLVVLADYFHLLRKWETGLFPQNTGRKIPIPRFMEAIQKKGLCGLSAGFFPGGYPR